MSLLDHWVAGDMPCAIVKHENGGHLCGYIGVPPSHPWYGRDEGMGSNQLPHIDVHGGITYASHSIYGHPTEIALLEERSTRLTALEERSPTSTPLTEPHIWERLLAQERDRQGKPRNYPCNMNLDVWWLGFDCSHLGDEAPGWSPGEGVYRDEGYVRREIEKLVSQAADAARTEAGGEETEGGGRDAAPTEGGDARDSVEASPNAGR